MRILSHFLIITPELLRSLITGKPLRVGESSENEQALTSIENVHMHKARDHGDLESQKQCRDWWKRNIDEDYDPSWRPDEPHEVRKASFEKRNPGHNFTHYVIGVTDRNFVRYGKHPTEIWSRDGWFNWAVIHVGQLKLPFFSFRNHFLEGYLGWRESGNFGIAFRRAHRNVGFIKKLEEV